MEFNIDFDEASAAWMKNKRPIGNGSYKYICTQLTKGGINKCNKYSYNGNEHCKRHHKNI